MKSSSNIAAAEAAAAAAAKTVKSAAHPSSSPHLDMYTSDSQTHIPEDTCKHALASVSKIKKVFTKSLGVSLKSLSSLANVNDKLPGSNLEVQGLETVV